MNKEFRKRLFINIGILLVVTLGLGSLIWFLSRDIKYLSSSIVETRRQVAARSQEISLFFNLRENFKEAESYFSVLDNALPKRENLYLFNQEVYRLGNMNNLGRPSFSFGSETASTAASPGRAKFTIFISGSHEDILNFLKDLERSRHFINIENFDMIQRDSKLNGQLSGEVLFR